MLQPRKMKYRKYQKNISFNKAKNNLQLAFGQYGIKAMSGGYISAKAIEAIRQTLNRNLKKMGKIWIRIYPDIPRTKKPAEVRMGKGKGAIAFWTAPVSSGQILFEINALSYETAFQATQFISNKLSIPIQFVERDTYK
jgi:large subunit ribosomal protein L16